jgi:PAS domain S-box-containing protein
MSNQNREEHVTDVAALRQRIVELEMREAERKQVQEKLQESEARFRALVESSVDHIFVLDGGGRYLISNNRVEQFDLQAGEQLVGRHLSEVYAPDVAELYQQQVEQVITTGQPLRFEHPMPNPDGIRYHVDTLFPLQDDGAVWAVGGICHDITVRNQMEQALRESEERFRAIFIGAPDAMFLANPESGQILNANPAASQLLLRPEEELVGLHQAEIYPSHLQKRNTQTFRDHIRLGQQGKMPQPLETFVLRADGRPVPVEVMTQLIPIKGRQVLLGIFRDISERRSAQSNLRQLSRAVEQSPSTVVITDTQGRIEYVNPKFSQLTGYAPESVVGLNPRFLKSGRHPPEFYEQLWATILSGREWRGEFANRKRNGDLYWEMASISPVRNEQGAIVHFVKVAADVTEQKQAEEALRQSTIELQARNEDLDAFAHTVAHDLLNPLGLMLGFADALAEDHTALPDGELRRYLRTISSSAHKMRNIVDELLLLASVRRSDVDMVPLDMAQIVAEAQGRLTDMIEEHQADIVMPDTWPQVMGHSLWVEQVWVNYLSNAIKYGGQPPRIQLGFEMEAVRLEPQGDDVSPQMVRFWVRDNGSGLTHQEQAQLFAPFTRLGQVRARGYGLGLSIVQRIVEKLGGQVGVESEGIPGMGSTFRFTLPRGAH